MSNQKDNVSSKVQFNKNGYEIRTDVLEMAKQFTEFEFSNKWMGWEQTTKRNKETGQLEINVKMPDVPTTDQVLENAEKFYNFVNGNPKEETSNKKD
jgi:hypothetical protein|tara:strand:+ start:812 stop:1102 length:291 start_codon:yes stop_codon:yes gene_type:complete